jgi:hypothetical protein
MRATTSLRTPTPRPGIASIRDPAFMSLEERALELAQLLGLGLHRLQLRDGFLEKALEHCAPSLPCVDDAVNGRDAGGFLQ